MNTRKILTRVIAAALVLLMCLSLLPAMAFAANNWTEVTLDSVQKTDMVAITMEYGGKTYALLNNGGTSTYGPLAEFNPSATAATIEQLWNVEAVTDGYKIFKLNSTDQLYCLNDDNNGLRVGTPGSTAFGVFTCGVSNFLQFTDAEGATRNLGLYIKSDTPNNWRCYKQYQEGLSSSFANQTVKYYKWNGAAPGETPATEGTCAEAAAGATGSKWKVTAMVMYTDGQSLYCQDSTGGICVRLPAKDQSVQVGDVIQAEGTIALYSGLVQLNNATYTSATGVTAPTAKAVTVSGLTKADVSTLVKLTGLTVTEIYDGSDHSYTNPNVTFVDGDGKTIQLYKANVAKNGDAWAVEEGDVVDLVAVVDYNNNKYRLRNPATDNVTVKSDVSAWLAAAAAADDKTEVANALTAYEALSDVAKERDDVKAALTALQTLQASLDVDAAVKAWNDKYAALLTKDVGSEDLDALEEALAAYEAIKDAVGSKLNPTEQLNAQIKKAKDALAAEAAASGKVTSLDALTTGTYVLVAGENAPLALDGTWVSVAKPVFDGAKITDNKNAIWTITVNSDGTVKIKDSNGKYIAPKGGNNNGIKEGEYNWKVEFKDGKFYFKGTGEDTVVLASNVDSEGKFRAYKNSTAEGYPNAYLAGFDVYKVSANSNPKDGDPALLIPMMVVMALSATGMGIVIKKKSF